MNALNGIRDISTQIDSFQDPLQWLLQQNMSEIDSFQDPCVLHRNWLLSRPCTATHTAKHHKLTPFKTLMYGTHFKTLTFYIGIDSFQDPYHFRTQISGTDTPSSELSQTQPNSVISRPSNWIYTVSQSPWETTCKISMGDYLQELSTKLSTKWILDFFGKIKRTHWMHLVNSSQATSLAHPAFGTTAFAKTHSFQDPKNFTYIVDSNNHVQTLSHQLRHRKRTS